MVIFPLCNKQSNDGFDPKTSIQANEYEGPRSIFIEGSGY